MESVNLSLVALVIAVVLIDVPASMQVPGSALHYFLIGLVFNAARFLVLGLAIGYPCRRLYGPARRSRFSIVKGDTK
jgi:nitrogen fixation/metabolism regulation signal transduction histidine kinase